MGITFAKQHQQITTKFSNKMIASFKVLACALVASSSVMALPAGPPAPYDEVPKPYAYEYGVQDSYSGAAFGQTENADGKIVTGTYKVLLPDGRTQIVNYKADSHGYGGYVADVKYDGHAKVAPHPPPAYKPRPKPHHA